MVQFSESRTLHFFIPSLFKQSRNILHPLTHSGDLQGICSAYKCRCADCNIHIKDFLPLLESVVCFRGLGSTPIQGISIIYWRMLYISVRANFILEARIVKQVFLKLAPPRSKQLYEKRLLFIATSLVSLHTDWAEFPRLYRWAYVDSPYINTRAKTP